MSRKSQQALTLEKKGEIINEVDKGKLKKSEIAFKFGIAKSTLSTILKNRERIEMAYATNRFEPIRKRMRTAKSEELEIALLKWISEAKHKNIEINGAILQDKARFFANTFNMNDFQCSSGWLQRFKERHGILSRRLKNKEATIDLRHGILKNYEPCNIFNVIETALFWRALPSSTLSLRDMKCLYGEQSDERITALIVCNVDGTEKLPIFALGPSEESTFLADGSTLPVEYDYSEKSWMTSHIFCKWIKKLDQMFQSKGRNICLLLDDCGVYRSSTDLKAIKIIFLSPKMTAKLHLCYQSIVRCIKVYYRREIIHRAINSFDCDVPFCINLFDALTLLKLSWDSVSSESIRHFFSKAGFVEEVKFESKKEDISQEIIEKAMQIGLLLPFISFDTYVSMDDDVVTCETVTDTEVGQKVRSIKVESPPALEQDGNYETGSKEKVSLLEAFNALQTVRRFVTQQKNGSSLIRNVDSIENFLEKLLG